MGSRGMAVYGPWAILGREWREHQKNDEDTSWLSVSFSRPVTFLMNVDDRNISLTVVFHNVRNL